ncbi:hypothetical protein H5410_064031 [Solanum commersonii]|uniref:Uncharacterized protein n=1 Tax=Solanum commersonii TaxID=4109 RepID=A0A9J5W0H7_SOLCO|nr:hypothetical protein H5410_064031 [Solanum commersonii]
MSSPDRPGEAGPKEAVPASIPRNKANPFRDSGSILPTSLAYIVPSTVQRLSPWRRCGYEYGRAWAALVLRIFKGRGAPDTTRRRGALPAAGPYLRAFTWNLSLFGLQSSHLNICYYHQDLHRRPLRPARAQVLRRPPRPPTHRGWHLPRRPGVGRALKRHPFSGLVDWRQTSDLHVGIAAGLHEFPRPPASGIVHHLSGPDRYAHTRTLLEDQGRSAVHPGDPTNRLPYALRVYSPVDFAHMSDSLVRVSRRVEWGATGQRPGAQMRSTPEARAAYHNRGDGVPRAYREPGLWPPPIHAGPRPSRSADRLNTSFSSFPRGTCLLSVSRLYLALDGIYRPIGAAFPNNPTRRQRLVVQQGPGTTGLSPSLATPSRGLGPGPSLNTLLQTTIRTAEPTNFQAGLFPVRSPLLGESFVLIPITGPRKSPVLLFFVTTSPSREWVICAPAAFLGCGSRFSGSLSGIEP